ncbi:CheR family methyltransferase [Aliikangiella sp. IMCC44632]
MRKDFLITELIVHLLTRTTEHNFKHYSVAALHRRLESFIQTNGIKDIDALFTELIKQDAELVSNLVEYLTVTHTSFFRDAQYFEIINKTILSDLTMFNLLKVWSIGCSRGAEIYSVALLFELHSLLEKTVLLGTDINRSAIAFAQNGVFPIEQLKELQSNFKEIESLQDKSLLPYIQASKDCFSFTEKIKTSCHFTRHNILQNASMGHMHLILCRNVLIYLDKEIQHKVIKELIVPSLEPGGYLVLGEAENLLDFAQEVNLQKYGVGINIYRYMP